MSSTSSTAHRRDFCRALYLQPSPEKLGCGAWGGIVFFKTTKTTETEETTAKYSITKSLCGPCGLQIMNLARSAPHFSVLTCHFSV